MKTQSIPNLLQIVSAKKRQAVMHRDILLAIKYRKQEKKLRRNLHIDRSPFSNASQQIKILFPSV